MDSEECQRGRALQLYVFAGVRDLRVQSREHVQLRRNGGADCAPAVHGGTRTLRRRRHGRMGLLRVRESAPALHRASDRGSNRNRILRRSASDQWRRYVRVSPPASELAEEMTKVLPGDGEGYTNRPMLFPLGRARPWSKPMLARTKVRPYTAKAKGKNLFAASPRYRGRATRQCC